ncbi:hypothetical protein KF913_03920 [Candidatus Obscuribacterales bacterium]|nr:hypothetical protein [Candidatus Obscuribacterales bacterium]
MRVDVNWGKLTALSLLLPVFSAAPASARRDVDESVSAGRSARNEVRMLEKALSHQLHLSTPQALAPVNSLASAAHARQNPNAIGIPCITLRGVNLSDRAQHRAANRIIDSFAVIPGRAQLDLDLTSSERNITLPSKLFRDQEWVTIDVGGASKTFAAGQVVTAAEYVAIAQSMKTGSQSLNLSDAGIAASGEFSLDLLKQPQAFRGISDLVIPESVIAIDDVSKGALRISGDLVNRGEILGVSDTRGRQGRIFADNILNMAGAVISMDSTLRNGDMTAAGFIAGLVQLGEFSREGTKLLLNANNMIDNSGTIFSAGNLTMSAGELHNSGVIFTGDSMSVETQKVVNSGVVQSIGAAMSLVATNAVETFSVVNSGGRIDAGNGHLYMSAATPISVIGGTLNAELVQFNSPNSAVNVAVDSINGLVDVIAFTSAVHVATGNLSISSIHVLDDPIFTNSSGNITLPANVTASGAPVTAVAAGSILGASGGTVINTSSDNNNGGDVILLAGVSNTTNNGITTVSGASGLTGSISGITSINSASGGNGTGGTVTLGAYGGTITVTGSITADGRRGGKVSIYSPGDISLGDVTSIGAHDRVDYITIRTVDPSLAGVLKFDSTGKLTQGGVAGGTTYGGGSIVAGNLESGARGGNGFNSGNILMQAGGSVTTGYLRAMGGGAPVKGWALQGYDYGSDGGHGGNISVVSLNGGLTVNGDINTSGGGGGGANHTAGGTGGDGGNILLTAIADVVINGPVLAPGGGGGGGVGISSTDTAGGGGSLGNGGGPNSGGLFYAPPPYDGPGMLDNGLNPHNPNHPRFPYAGMGGTNTAYDIGCCGSGYGGDVGNYGENGDEGTFAPRGYWNDTTPKKGGAPGIGGNITITGRDIDVTKTIQTAFATKEDINKSPYADFSIFTHSQRGGGQINLTTSGGNVASTVYAGASDLESSNPVIAAQIRNGSVTLAGRMRGDQVKLNDQSLATTSAAGEIVGAGDGSITITVGGAQKTVTNGDLVTASEWIALIQKGTTGAQSLQLASGGAANSGSFGIAAENIPASGFSQLVVPANVTANLSAPSLIAANSVVNGVVNVVGNSTIQSNSLSVAGSIVAAEALTINSPQLNLASNSQIIAELLSIGGSSFLNINLTAGPVPGVVNLSGVSISLGGNDQVISFANSSGNTSQLNFNAGQTTIVGSTLTNSADSTLQFNDGPAKVSLSGTHFTNNGTVKAYNSVGDGGSLSVESSSSAFTFAGGNLSVTAEGGEGNGGHLSILAPSAALTINGGTLDASGSGGFSFEGGSVEIAARGLNIIGSPLVLKADGVNGGYGGLVSVSTTGSDSDLIVDGGANHLQVSAHGGLGSGSGGTIRLSAGRNLLANSASVDVSVKGPWGSGGSLDLEAGTAGDGSVLYVGDISADGKLIGNGGTVRIASNSSTPLVIGSATVNGVAGTVSAQGADGGSVTFENAGTGGIRIDDHNFVSVQASGRGGKLQFATPNGNLDLAAGDYSVGSAYGSGGEILVDASTLTVTGAGGASLQANGGAEAAGGLVDLSVRDQSLSLSAGSLSVFATGGSSASSGGDGGTVRVHAGGDLSIASGAVDAGAKGNAGNGGAYELWAGTSPSMSGKLLVDGNLDASGKGNGAGGSVAIEIDSPEVFTVGGVGIVNGITGSIIANGGGIGSAGSVSIANRGTDALSILVNSAIDTGGGSASFASHGDLSVVVPGSFNGQFTGLGDSVTFDNQHGDAIIAGIAAQDGEVRVTGDSVAINGTIAGTGFMQVTSRSGVDVNADISVGNASLRALGGSVRVNEHLTATGNVTLEATDSVRFDSGGFIDASGISILSGDGGIISSTSSSVATASRVDLLSTAGNIGGLTPLIVDVSGSLSMFTSGTGSVNVKDVSTGKVSLLDSYAGGSFTFLASGPLDVNDILTLDGDISVTTLGGNFYVMPGSTISTAGGSVTLRSDDLAGSFKIGANSKIVASSTDVGAGNVFIGYGEQATKLSKPKKRYKNIDITYANGGGIYLSKGGLQTAKPTSKFTADGGKIVFQNASKRKKSAVSIGGGVEISANAPSATVASSFASIASIPESRLVAHATSVKATVSSEALDSRANDLLNSHDVTFDSNHVSIASPVLPTDAYGGGPVKQADTTNISSIDLLETSDLRINLISTSDFHADTSGGVSQPFNSASTFLHDRDVTEVPMEIGLWSHDQLVPELANSAAVSTFSLNQLRLNRGAVVFAPAQDTDVKLPGMSLKLARNSVALVVATGDAVSIYDFDDRRKGSVVIETPGERIALSPGQHVTIASGSDDFANLNPLEAIPHRALSVSRTRTGKSMFSSEFSVVAAMQGLKPIAGVLSSKNNRSRQIASNLMKTAAVILQLRPADDFQVHAKPQLAAWQR